MIVIQSPRLQLSQFQMTDAQGFWMHHARHRQIHAVGAAIVERVRDAMREETAGTTTEQVFFRHSAARQQGMPWYGLVGRRGFCFARTRTLAQEKRTRAGFWPEVVAALVEWGHATLGKGSFVYPAAVQNAASRRIAENLHGEIIGNRTNPKYDSVVYRIPGVTVQA